MKTKKLSKLLIMVLLILTACNSQELKTMTPLPAETAAPSFASTSTPIALSTHVLATQTPVFDNSLDINSKCLNIQADAGSVQGKGSGSLVIAPDARSSALYTKLHTPYLYQVATDKKTDLPGAYNFTVSLDQTRMAYLSVNDKLIIADENGKAVKQIELGNYRIHGWGQDGLFIEGNNGHAFLNLNTEKIQALNQEFTDMYPIERWKLWNPITIYDPLLTRVVYPALDSSKSETSIVLWDVQNKTELARVSQGHAISILPEMKPEWTSDGQDVILAVLQKSETLGSSERKLISIDKNGSIKILLNIPKDIGTLQFSVSPNNAYVAFWSPDPTSSMLTDLTLYILDIENNQLTNYCLISPLITDAPIWSPDSKQVAVELLQDPENSEVVIIDLEKNLAIKIAENAKPVGWLK